MHVVDELFGLEKSDYVIYGVIEIGFLILGLLINSLGDEQEAEQQLDIASRSACYNESVFRWQAIRNTSKPLARKLIISARE